MKLFIHRWFGGSVHPKVLFVKGKQWNYPRLANYAVPMMAGAIITGGHLFFVVGFCMVVPLFLYTALSPLSLEEWYECYKDYWKRKGFSMSEYYEGDWTLRIPDNSKQLGYRFASFYGTRSEAIALLFFEIYGKWPMRV